jgi:hypothetical protein
MDACLSQAGFGNRVDNEVTAAQTVTVISISLPGFSPGTPGRGIPDPQSPFSSPCLMLKVSCAGKDHRDTVFVARFD